MTVNAIPEQYRRHRISVEDYHRMAKTGILGHEARVELINGEIIEMPPIGKRHMGKVDRLNRWLVRAADDDAIIRTQGSIRLSGFSEPEPDLMLLRPRDDFYESELASIADVMLLIEVSVSSLRYDIDVKLPLYAKAGIAEVWIVNVVNGRLHRFADPFEGRWQLEDSPDKLDDIAPRLASGMSLDLSTLF